MRSAALALLLGLGCAHPRTAPYLAATARAARAAHAGRHREAAALWSEATPLADRPRDADDTRYRAADAWSRAGETDRAVAEFDALASSAAHPPIAARARLEAALLRLRRDGEGDRARALADLDALIANAPDRGSGRRALDHRLRLFDEGPDPDAAVAWLRARATDAAIRDSDLDASVSHLLALRLARAGRRDEAVTTWQNLFSRRGFGHNPRWDDGHLALAQTLLDAGDPRGAVEALDALFEPWTTSWFVGSYTGPRMPEAALLRARIYRDVLRDPVAAGEAYRFVYERLEHSTLRDDAMAEAAELLDRRGEDGCPLWRRLVTELACSPRARRATERARACGAAPPRCRARVTGE
ncbi:MAG: hypothetical protein R3A48_23585 [Polyangiales bacterium]